MSSPESMSPAVAAAAVDVRGVVKRYPMFARRRDRALAFLGATRHLRTKTALQGVSFTAAPGEAVGLIGENGSGKTTLLRLVAGITRPDAGTVYAQQPVAALLELGLGFHGEFTGRENAMLYGALVGIPEDVMRHRLDEVLAFAELGEFVDQPLRTYSSGMGARLAFAVATHVAPQVLVVDEALAVGDGAFQKKCVERMVRFKDEGRTVLFCSHAMYLVAEFCERSVWLREGRVAALGPSRDVILAYEDHLRRRGRRDPGQVPEPARSERSLARLTRLEVEPASGQVAAGEEVRVHLTVERDTRDVPVHVLVAFVEEGGLTLADCYTRSDEMAPLVGGGRQEVTLRLPQCPFLRGTLDVVAYLMDPSGLHVMDQMSRTRALRPATSRWLPGHVVVEHRWELG